MGVEEWIWERAGVVPQEDGILLGGKRTREMGVLKWMTCLEGGVGVSSRMPIVAVVWA